MLFNYALSLALASSALAQVSAPVSAPVPVINTPPSTSKTTAKTSGTSVKTSLSPAAASSAAASIASRVVSEINAAATAASSANTIAKTINQNNVLSTGPQVAGALSTIITDLSDATNNLASISPGTVSHSEFNPSACMHAADPQTCVNDAVSKLALPAQKRDAHAGSIAARAAQASGSGSASITFSVNEQAAIANAYKNYATLQSTLASSLAQARANIGYYLIPIRNSIIVLQGTADALALAIQNDVAQQYDAVVAQARSGLDSSLQVTIKAYAS